MIYNQIVTWTAFAILAMFFSKCISDKKNIPTVRFMRIRVISLGSDTPEEISPEILRNGRDGYIFIHFCCKEFCDSDHFERWR